MKMKNEKIMIPGSAHRRVSLKHVATGSRFRTQSGFTLLELIISMVILSLVALLIGSGFNISINAWNKGEEETSETQRLRILSSMLSQQIKSAYPYEVKIEGEKLAFFLGKAESITFVTTMTDASFGGLKWVRYYYEDDVLIYKEGILPDKEFIENIEGMGEVMEKDLGSVKFEYYSSAEDEWDDSWEFSESIPAAVRVKISYFQPFQINIPLGQKVDNKKDA